MQVAGRGRAIRAQGYLHLPWDKSIAGADGPDKSPPEGPEVVPLLGGACQAGPD